MKRGKVFAHDRVENDVAQSCGLHGNYDCAESEEKRIFKIRCEPVV